MSERGSPLFGRRPGLARGMSCRLRSAGPSGGLEPFRRVVDAWAFWLVTRRWGVKGLVGLRGGSLRLHPPVGPVINVEAAFYEREVVEVGNGVACITCAN